MKKIINSSYLSTIIFILSIVVAVKLLWLVVSLLFLPESGENYKEPTRVKKLYYRVKLTNEEPTLVVYPPHVPIKVTSMKGYNLLGLYNAPKKLVVTIDKSGKTTILEKGENIDGFKLVSAGSNYVIFEKLGEKFKLSLSKIKKSATRVTSSSSKREKTVSGSGAEIVEEDGVKHISRNLLTSYTKDLDKVWKDISIGQSRKNGKINGFKINYVREGSDFEKLGLKKGDTLMAINAEELNSMSAAMNLFKEIKDIENLTLTVERNGKREELEYEIK